ncbi:MAG: helix-turn-helix domain-containing protein [Candidatus Zixiibacteriota bacterium]
MSHRRTQAKVFKALGNELRREILDYLKDRPRTTGEICARFRKRDRCTIMQHLRVLEEADLIIVKRRGRTRWNYLNALPIRDIYHRWISRYATPSVELLAKLKRDLEE